MVSRIVSVLYVYPSDSLEAKTLLNMSATCPLGVHLNIDVNICKGTFIRKREMNQSHTVIDVINVIKSGNVIEIYIYSYI